MKFFQVLNFVYEFFEVSLLNFIITTDEKFYKQCFVEKKSGKKKSTNILRNIGDFFEWFLVTSEGIAYVKKEEFFNKKMREYCFYKNYLKIYFKSSNRLNVSFRARQFQLKFDRQDEMIDFFYDVILSFENSSEEQQYRYGSFSPICSDNSAKFYINGFTEPNYFGDLCDSLQKAQRSILITDWWLSPEIFLKRPIEDHPYSKLETVLHHAAKRGIKVLILVYKESPKVLPNDSLHTKNRLESLHQNIIVVRHPYNLINYWSHHEKMIVIDNKILFMGGLDLCFGRYEALDYPLQEPDFNKTIWYGQDYSNPRIVDFANVSNYSLTLINKQTQPRMPWRDQAIQVRGPVVSYMTKHFREYWEYANLQNGKKQTVNTVILNKELSVISDDLRQIQDHYGSQQYDPQSPMYKYQQGLNEVQKSLKVQLVQAVKKNVKINEGHFLTNQQWQSIKDLPLPDNREQKNKFQSYRDMPLVQNLSNKLTLGKIQKSFVQLLHNDEPDQPLQYDNYDHDQCYDNVKNKYDNTLNIQALRSGSYWSIGLKQDKHEDSIQQAYLNLINNSQRYIYIENQFFVSSTYGKAVKNTIADTIAKRVIRAIDNKEPFCVFIFIPLLPGFFGHITEKSGDVLRIQVDLHLKTIYQAQNSMIRQIQKHTKNWQAYVKIFGLRNYTIFKNEPKTEMVYIHSKLMIVDDMKMIVGSANINDRSQLGQRDSEIALIIEDTKIDNNLGKHYYSQVPKSRYIRDYRVNCMKSMFKLDIDYDDILNQDFIQAIEQQAQFNDAFYFNVFHIYPHNSLKTLADVRLANQKDIDRQYFFENKDKVIGIAVTWPYQFLEGQKNFVAECRSLQTQLAPMKIFT